jgi:hypothetical protein
MEQRMTLHVAARPRWSDPAVVRALLLAALVIVLVLAPIALGMNALGQPAFDITPDPAGPLPF